MILRYEKLLQNKNEGAHDIAHKKVLLVVWSRSSPCPTMTAIRMVTIPTEIYSRTKFLTLRLRRSKVPSGAMKDIMPFMSLKSKYNTRLQNTKNYAKKGFYSHSNYELNVENGIIRFCHLNVLCDFSRLLHSFLYKRHQ